MTSILRRGEKGQRQRTGQVQIVSEAATSQGPPSSWGAGRVVPREPLEGTQPAHTLIPTSVLHNSERVKDCVRQPGLWSFVPAALRNECRPDIQFHTHSWSPCRGLGYSGEANMHGACQYAGIIIHQGELQAWEYAVGWRLPGNSTAEVRTELTLSMPPSTGDSM